MKRYLEAGGGGIVAVRDTLHSQNGWTWLSFWNGHGREKHFKQDDGQISILPRHFTASEL